MHNYFYHPVRLLFVAYACSLILFSYLYWNQVNNIVAIQPLHTTPSAVAMTSTLTKAYGKSIGDWIMFVGIVALLNLLFLIGLKLVCSIEIKDIILFLLITIPSALFLNWLFVMLPFINNANYFIPVNLVGINFLLLKLSGQWSSLIDEGLPD